MGMRTFPIILCAALMLIPVSGMSGAAGASDRELDPPRGPGDVPPPPEETPGDARRAVPHRILLFLISVPVLALEAFSIYDPREAYLMFRRGLKYEGEVELTDLYLSLTRWGGIIGVILYSLLLVTIGEWAVLIAASTCVLLLGALLIRKHPA